MTIQAVVNYVFGIPSCEAYTYAATEVTAIGTELSAMLTAYLPAILLIFATIFALFFFRKQIQIWLGR